MRLDPTLLQVIACPVCHSPLEPDDVAGELLCTGCPLAYPVRDDIPVLLADQARTRS